MGVTLSSTDQNINSESSPLPDAEWAIPHSLLKWHQGESRAAQRCPLPHTHTLNLDITHSTWSSGFLLHIAEVSLAIRTEVVDVPVLSLNPPGKGKPVPSSHLVQGSQQPWQAGRAGPKETKLDF